MVAFDFLHSEAQFGDNLLERNPLVVLVPLAGFRDGSLFFLIDGFIVKGRVSQGGRYRIDHRFQQSDQGRELRLGKLVNQAMRILTGIAHTTRYWLADFLACWTFGAET